MKRWDDSKWEISRLGVVRHQDNNVGKAVLTRAHSPVTVVDQAHLPERVALESKCVAAVGLEPHCPDTEAARVHLRVAAKACEDIRADQALHRAWEALKHPAWAAREAWDRPVRAVDDKDTTQEWKAIPICRWRGATETSTDMALPDKEWEALQEVEDSIRWVPLSPQCLVRWIYRDCFSHRRTSTFKRVQS